VSRTHSNFFPDRRGIEPRPLLLTPNYAAAAGIPLAPDGGMMRMALCVCALLVLISGQASALERLCDPSVENCRTQLLSLIDNETQEVDVGFWFLEDNHYVQHIVARFNAGVRVRLLVDPRGSASSPFNQGVLDAFASAGIPMRKRVTSSILHWKMALFGGQHVVEFSGANFSDNAWHPVSPYTNYVDESIYFTNDPDIVTSFMRKFDDSWVDTTSFADYANITNPPARSYPAYSIYPSLNFPPSQSYATRSISLYGRETSAIDVIMYRITQQSHSDAIAAAVARGIPVRLITEPNEYRNPKRVWDAWNVDRMWKAGVKIRMRAHAGLNHQKSVILHGLHTVIFGSSNWSSPSDRSQQEHNYFVDDKAWMVAWFTDQFNRKWNNSNPAGAIETKAFTPLPPDAPKYKTPSANGATGASRTARLVWYGGPWAHDYDIYFGTSSTPPLYSAGRRLGPSETTSQTQSYTIPFTLAPHATYYFRIVSKTAAGKSASGATWSFTTGS
jgi:phosphatidylserine/phosphatidylglycerophosphate/cardiolipin synthase-like enzyme